MARVLTGADLSDVLDVDIEYAPVFAYGTLRTGEVLAHRLDVAGTADGVVHGAKLYTYPQWGYPFMVMERGGTAYGELLWVERNHRLMSTALMEINAGYNLEVVNVYTSSLEEYVPAITFTFPQPPPGSEQILSGDWKLR